MVARSKASTQAVDIAEDALRQVLDQRSEPHLKRAAAQAEATARAFMRWRLQQCELAAGLVVGQAMQREARLDCTWQLNQARLRQIEAVRTGLPPG